MNLEYEQIIIRLEYIAFATEDSKTAEDIYNLIDDIKQANELE